MIVQIGVEEVAIEAVERLSASGIDVAIAEVLADDGAVLGLLDAQLVEQAGHGFVEELAAVAPREGRFAGKKFVRRLGDRPRATAVGRVRV